MNTLAVLTSLHNRILVELKSNGRLMLYGLGTKCTVKPIFTNFFQILTLETTSGLVTLMMKLGKSKLLSLYVV